MPLVINVLGADTQTHVPIPICEPKLFQETRCTLAYGWYTPGLIFVTNGKGHNLYTSTQNIIVINTQPCALLLVLFSSNDILIVLVV